MNYFLTKIENDWLLVSDEELSSAGLILASNKVNTIDQIEFEQGFVPKFYKKIIAGIIRGISGIPSLDLSLVSEQLWIIDVEKKAKNFTYPKKREHGGGYNTYLDGVEYGFREGANWILSLLKDKKWTDEDLKIGLQYFSDNLKSLNAIEKTIDFLSQSKMIPVDIEEEIISGEPAGNGDAWNRKQPKITDNTIKILSIKK